MATILDVAREACVSVATVSRAINDSPDVRGATRKRVLEVAARMNYRPNAAARHLRRPSRWRPTPTSVVALMAARDTIARGDPFSQELLAAVQAALCDRGLSIRVVGVSADGNMPPELANGEVAGILSRVANPLARRIASVVPTISIDTYDPVADAFSVMPHYAEGFYAATSRLLAAGHRQLALLANEPGDDTDGFSFWQVFPQSCVRAYHDRGLPLPERLCRGPAATPAEGYLAGRRIFADPAQAPDAVLGPDGAMIGVYRAAGEAGLRIPQDVSIVGVNNLSYTEHMFPSLTTIDVGIAALAARAVHLLVDSLSSGEKRRGVEIMPVVLRERESTRF